MCNVDILNKSKGEFTVKEDKYIFVDPTNSYCVVINDEGEYMIVEKNKLKSMATAKEIKEQGNILKERFILSFLVGEIL